ncbi:MAG: outer membrane beta-barrel protein [Terricaulis sp.]
MKKYLLGAAALLAMAAPAVAHADPTGYVGLDYANTHIDGLGSADGWGAEGAVAFDGGSGVAFELDANVLDNDSDTAWGAAGHLFVRNDQYLFGGFVGATTADSDTVWNVGLEANSYFSPNWTLAGALQYGSDDDTNAWGVNAALRYFATDNFRIQGTAAWADLDTPGGGDNLWSLGAGAEYQFATTPISLGLDYTHSETDDSDLSADSVKVSLRWNFGGGSLLERDRHGASQADLVGVGAL